MKLQLLHGPAINNSRTKLLEIKNKFPGNISVFDHSASLGQVLESLMGQTLFDESQLVIWENPPDDFVLDSSFSTLNSSLTLWFDHEIDPKKWPKGEVIFFPEVKEISVFPFLDKLGNKDKRAFLELDKLKKDGADTQYIITMIFYLLRNLVATPKGVLDFVKNKNERMRKNFSEIELKNLYKFVLDVDFKIKSGLLEKPQAEFLLVNLFTH